MTSTNTLESLGKMLLSDGVKIINFTRTPEPNTSILQLPPDFVKNTPRVAIHKILKYDLDGPLFAWNWMVRGEHTGTHFDAPHYWITGKDYEGRVY
jgi:kynurenine formamidase